jgi:hypothetical protein
MIILGGTGPETQYGSDGTNFDTDVQQKRLLKIALT